MKKAEINVQVKIKIKVQNSKDRAVGMSSGHQPSPRLHHTLEFHANWQSRS